MHSKNKKPIEKLKFLIKNVYLYSIFICFLYHITSEVECLNVRLKKTFKMFTRIQVTNMKTLFWLKFLVFYIKKQNVHMDSIQIQYVHVWP